MNKVNFEEVKNEIVKREKNRNGVVDLFFMVLANCHPIAGITKELIEKNVNAFQKSKQEEFCDIVLSDSELLTTDKISDVKFVMEFVKMLDVVNRLVQNDKVIFCANLFKRTFIDSESYNLDRYEEYLHKLEYLSFQELTFLIELYRYSEGNVKEYHEEWYDFKSLMAEKCKLSENVVVDIFSGLSMTGFVRQCEVLFPFDGEMENPYYVTEYFKMFVKFIVVEEI